MKDKLSWNHINFHSAGTEGGYILINTEKKEKSIQDEQMNDFTKC